MNTHVILLRGVMPTGKNRVPMADLRAVLTEAGLVDVQTYIQSGNVIARSRLDHLAVQRLVHDMIAQRIGADIAVIARSPEQIRRILERSPFLGEDSSRVYFSLLESPPDPFLLGGFLKLDFSPDDVKVDGDTIYTLYATKLSDSRFSNTFFERRLKVPATTRNYNTMSRLLELGIKACSG